MSDLAALFSLALGAGDGSSAPSASALQPRFPELEVQELLGQGGMGLVYRVDRDGEPLALKLLRPELAEDPRFVARMEREAATLATLEHPGIVAVREVGERDGLPYLLLELVEGPTLRERLRQAPPDEAQAIDWIEQAAGAIAAAHGAGVLHRDIKPENLMLDGERVVLVDFGLARPAGPGSELTATGELVGTPHYLAPELLDGGEPTARGDVYALAVTAYELLTGKLPIGRFPAPGTLVDVSPELDAALLAALDPDPERRPADGAALLAALRARPRPLPLWPGHLALLLTAVALGSYGLARLAPLPLRTSLLEAIRILARLALAAIALAAVAVVILRRRARDFSTAV